MPRGDGTGPASGAGRGRGRMGGPYKAGPGGQCVCPKCGATAAHAVGQPSLSTEIHPRRHRILLLHLDCILP